MKIIATVTPSRPWVSRITPDQFARAFGTWMHVMQLDPRDYLGQTCEETATANHCAGQFFTPEPVV